MKKQVEHFERPLNNIVEFQKRIMMVKGFCYICGKDVFFPIVIKMPCPMCMAEYDILLCPDCARKIVNQINSQLQICLKLARELNSYIKQYFL